MNLNDSFLQEFMNRVDMRLFTPSLYRYLKKYLEIERVRRHNGFFVINTFIPPFPGRAFDRFLSTYFEEGKRTPVQSVDLAVTNACMFHCWHCYNAGRPVADLSTEQLKGIVRDLQDQGAIVLNFTGGEPCLRHDLVEICSELREDACGILSTTGYGFTDEMARRLRDTGVYSISISLDSADEAGHDRKRGVKGAFRIALKGIETAKKWGFYTYTCAVPAKKLLEEENFRRLVELNENLGVDEIQLIEPAPAGRLLFAKFDFGEEEFEKEFQYMAEYNSRPEGVAITSFAHMESPEFFGCGAGTSHIYIDGTGEVSPCNMIPISYGNAARENLGEIIKRMQEDFKHPCQFCLAQSLREFSRQYASQKKPVDVRNVPSVSLPELGELPGFFKVIEERQKETAGREEIVLGYDGASETYDDYWLSVASGPIEEMFAKLEIPEGARGIDCGCGTGYSTEKLARLTGSSGSVLGIDLSAGMIEKAKMRCGQAGLSNVDFRVGDVLEELRKLPPNSFDLAVMTWLIGYVGCDEIFPILINVLKPGGIIGLVAHLDRSPRVPIEVFEELTRENPDVLTKAVKLKFPKDAFEVEYHLKNAGFTIHYLQQGTFDFICQRGEEVYDHVMKSGAGTTFYYSLKASERERLTREFIRRVEQRFSGQPRINIVHEYVVGIGTVVG